jgi:hypothetical protein
MYQLQQAIGNGTYITGEPAVSYDFEKKVNKNGIHAYHGKKLQMPAMVTQIDPPIAESKE